MVPFKKINTSIYQGHIQFTESDSTDIYKRFLIQINAVLLSP